MTHPMAFTHHRNGGTNKLGQKMSNGDRVRYMIDGRTGTADEFLQDGDTYITWDDGTFGTVKWYHLEPFSEPDVHQS